MKKQFRLALLGAIALTGTVGFTACSSSDEATAEVNPSYNVETNEVTAQFVLNVASADMNATKQSSTIVQKNSNFRGMQDAKLIGLSTGNGTTKLAPYNGEATTDASYTVKKTFDLGTIYAATAVDNTGSNNANNSSRRVLELSLPLTTDAMLVYARAIPASATNAEATNGKVTMNVTTNPENITFDLNSRLNGRGEEYNQASALACRILNRIMDTDMSAATTWDRNGYVNVAPLPALNWKQLGTSVKNNETLTPLEEILGVLFNTITDVKPGEYRAGSSSAIRSIAHHIYVVCTSVYNATPTNDGELNAQRLANEINERIKNYFENYDQDTSADGLTGIQFLTLGAYNETGTIAYRLARAIGMTESEYNSLYGSVQQGDLKGFPTSFGLPYGVALLHYVDGIGFTYTNPSSSLLVKDAVLAADRYMYPAELLYFDNSALRVNDNSLTPSDYPNGYNTWDTETWSGWTTGPIQSTTRSVAVKNNINYGVAMLQTKIALDGTAFSDNRHGIVTTESDQSLTEADVKKFQLIGVLVGGQNPQMGWNYLAKDNAADKWNYVVYDDVIPGTGAIPTPAGEENYTLLFDNYNSTAQSDVYVALELRNNSKDFYGKHNLIRYGGTFYLVGKLVLGSNTIADANWPQYYAVPPYDASGNSQKISRIFTQDFMTTATFKIGAESLKNAFVTVPDLRSAQSSLGLSVDLQWKTGLSFETELGGLVE